ncbi:chitobiase/beta-hexosaminidase C-terminal domain-containing protein [Coraliomargarita sp. W4R72]
MSDFLVDLQSDLEGLLLSDPRLSEIPVLVERKGITEDDIANAIGVFNTREGSDKTGLAIVVAMPGIESPAGGSTMLQFKTSIALHVFELPVVNLSDSGHGISAESLAMQLLDLTHHWSAVSGRTLTPDSRAITPGNAAEGYIGYDVNLVWQDGLTATPRTERPKITYDEATEKVSITCSDSDAIIYYTDDGTFPYPENPTVQIYNEPVTNAGVIVTHVDSVVTYGEPFTALSSTEIRAIAIAPEKLPSNLKSITLSTLSA